ncbi:MAG: ferritin-like domain-containing protein [Pseudonocardia sp.]|nr:ferritin-like domain-containing protein [Pseudonocardia sp.]
MAQTADFGSDIDVLNYALILEYLEAATYQQGTTKSGPTTPSPPPMDPSKLATTRATRAGDSPRGPGRAATRTNAPSTPS